MSVSVSLACSDGVGRTGTFICLHSQLERLKTEGLVDLFQAVKSARIQRAGLVPDAVRHMHWPSHCSVFSVTATSTPPQDQYAYCHEVLADFINSFDNYANFKDVV